MKARIYRHELFAFGSVFSDDVSRNPALHSTGTTKALRVSNARYAGAVNTKASILVERSIQSIKNDANRCRISFLKRMETKGRVLTRMQREVKRTDTQLSSSLVVSMHPSHDVKRRTRHTSAIHHSSCDKSDFHWRPCPIVFDVGQLFALMHSPSHILVGDLHTQLITHQIRKTVIAVKPHEYRHDPERCDLDTCTSNYW